MTDLAPGSPRRLIAQPLGDAFRVDADALALDLAEVVELSTLRSERVVAQLREIADRIDSEVLDLRELPESARQFDHSEAELLERTVAEAGKLGVVHDASGRVGVIRRVLGMLLHRPGKVMSRAHDGEPTQTGGAS